MPSEAIEVPPPGVPQSHRLESTAAAVTSTVPALPVSEGMDHRTPKRPMWDQRRPPRGVSDAEPPANTVWNALVLDPAGSGRPGWVLLAAAGAAKRLNHQIRFCAGRSPLPLSLVRA
jgi:hypothetical protein